MGQTITEKIFSEHAGKNVYAGEIVRVPIDMTIGNDITTPISIKAFEESGAKTLANPDGFAIVMDHYIPAKDIASANQAKISRDFAYKHDLKYFFDEKDMGIEHALLPEKGLVIPGDVIIGADSHTCTHGALGAFSTGMGSTDISFSIITGGNWFKVPESIKVTLLGKPGEHIYGKDIILELIRILGVDGALYQAIEFVGDGVQHLGMADRFSMCNMAIEAGAKSGIFAIDDISQSYLDERAEVNGGLRSEAKLHYSDADAKYVQEITIDMANLSPVIAYPFLPSNGKPVEQAVEDDLKIDQVMIGS
ncbi:MAG TPA: 3-isopropylmalate dehydratase large subunit, partial [Sulfurovum sp.]|nr:3-isopropylmalate dehydratase large subunit [Sulfurovum sp.]